MAQPFITGRRLPHGGLTDIAIRDRTLITVRNYRSVLNRLYGRPYHDALDISAGIDPDSDWALEHGLPGGYWCYYCRAFTHAEDHIPSLYVVWQKIQAGETLAGMEFLCVPACTQCNSRLGRKRLLTLAARVAYLQQQAQAEIARLEALLRTA